MILPRCFLHQHPSLLKPIGVGPWWSTPCTVLHVTSMFSPEPGPGVLYPGGSSSMSAPGITADTSRPFRLHLSTRPSPLRTNVAVPQFHSFQLQQSFTGIRSLGIDLTGNPFSSPKTYYRNRKEKQSAGSALPCPAVRTTLGSRLWYPALTLQLFPQL